MNNEKSGKCSKSYFSRNIKSILFLIMPALMSFSAFAVNITIDPVNLTNRYRVSTIGGYQAGLRTFDLVTSMTHSIEFGDQSNGFEFYVDAAGNISSDTTRATIIGSTIKLITTPINIDPQLYDMQYNAGRYLYGSQTIFVVGEGAGNDDYGNRWKLTLGDQSNGIYFYVDVNGVVSSNSSRFNIVGTDTIEFVTIPVDIDPGLFDMTYNIMGKYRIGMQTINLLSGGTGVDDFGSRYKAAFGDQSHGFFFDIDSNGNVFTDSTKVTVTSGTTISFVTTPVYFDTQLYELQYNVTGRYRFGSQTIYLVAEGMGSQDYGNRIKMNLGDRSNGVIFMIDTVGNLSTDSSRFTIIGGNTVAFDHTIPIDFDPGSYTGQYNVTGKNFSGQQTIDLVPAGTGTNDFNQGYKLYVAANNSSTIFDVEEPCAILPSETVMVGTGTNAVPFVLSCPNPIVDTDEDGVADSIDNCPTAANTGQLDQDNDGFGNVCDSDLDGDGVVNVEDNCPNIENDDQSDLDGNGEGDACDNDTDGDSVPTAADNCPLTPNTDQYDNDVDGSGDACDVDDDNDTILDEHDNCPNQSNTDQTDSDADGQGNVCDGDVDGDGVNNETDLCPQTASGLSTTDEGCSGTQHISLYCMTDDFPNHGRYVSCVTHTAKDMVSAGLISKPEKSRIVKQAAKK